MVSTDEEVARARDLRAHIDAREALEVVQRSEPVHYRIGAFVRWEKVAVPCRRTHEPGCPCKGFRVLEKRIAVRVTTAQVCPRCPSRRACRKASIALAEIETRIVGGANG